VTPAITSDAMHTVIKPTSAMMSLRTPEPCTATSALIVIGYCASPAGRFNQKLDKESCAIRIRAIADRTRS
jgi:hypothetical protein